VGLRDPFHRELQRCDTTRSMPTIPNGIVAGTQGLERLMPADTGAGAGWDTALSLDLLVQAGFASTSRPLGFSALRESPVGRC